jgi:hypothetical protein
MSWRVRGSCFEACNCDGICPCRRIDGVPGGRSTHGICTGALSWLIEAGAADGDEVVTCAIPGHQQPGEELLADRLLVRDDGLELEFSGVGGYAASFDYRG